MNAPDNLQGLSDGEISERLAVAINNQTAARIGQELVALPDGALSDRSRVLAGQAVAATDAISQRMSAIRDALTAKLRAARIDATAIAGAEDQGGLQYDSCTISVPGRAIVEAIAVAEAEGFRATIPLDAGRIRILRRSAKGIVLVRFDEAFTRVILRFGDSRMVPLPRALRPTMVDLDALRLPATMWPLYYVARPFRIAADRLARRRRPDPETDFLATPQSLIIPLLECLALTADDHFIDLGCGDGRIVTEAATRYGCRVTGIERDSGLAERARTRLSRLGLSPSRAKISHHTFDGADLSDATVIFLFLPSYLSAKVLPTIIRRVGADVRIMSHEQTRVSGHPQPDLSLPVFGADSLTVAHLWRGGAGSVPSQAS